MTDQIEFIRRIMTVRGVSCNCYLRWKEHGSLGGRKQFSEDFNSLENSQRRSRFETNEPKIKC